jgi:hypothetical protein
MAAPEADRSDFFLVPVGQKNQQKAQERYEQAG